MPGLPGRGRGSPARRTTAPGDVLVNYAAVCGLLSVTVWPSPCLRFQKIMVFPLSPSPVVGTSEHGCLGCKTLHACARNTKQMRRQKQTACDAVSSAGFCLGRSAVSVSQGTFGVWPHHLRPHPACLIPPSAGLRHSRHRRMRTRRTRVTSQCRRTAKKDASVVEVSPKVFERPEELLLLKAVLGVPMHVRPGLCHERAPPVDLGHLRKMPGS